MHRDRHLMTAAAEDHASIIDLTRDLVRIPSRGGLDGYVPILGHLSSWLSVQKLPVQVLTPDTENVGAPVGLICEVRGAHPGPRWVLNACLDTAPFGDTRAWTHPPTSAVVKDGWLWGRGSADSKVGAAIFCHLAARLAADVSHLHGTLVLLFDVDEHTGRFGGARRYFEGPDAPDDIAGVMIGYPGQDKLVVGGRGVYRAQLRVHGIAAHSGASGTISSSAIHKAAQLIEHLSISPLPHGASEQFPLPGKLTVTAVHGGDGYSSVPDLCTLNIDIRTTPTFDNAAAARHLALGVGHVDTAWPNTPSTDIENDITWPAYALPPHSPLRAALLAAARAAGIHLTPKIAGPSNIGNYLAGLDIPATAGFGVSYIGLHATDERIDIDTIPAVHATYNAAVLDLLGCRVAALSPRTPG